MTVHYTCSLKATDKRQSAIKCAYHELIDEVKVLRPTQHQIGHFVDVLSSQSIGLILENEHNKSKYASVANYTTTKN